VALPADILASLERRLRSHAGLELPAWVVESRARARMALLGVDAEHYVDLVSAPRSDELAALVEAVRVGETRFFRHRSQVAALTDVVIPAWRARGERAPRVWSAGCATGEEPYTLALVLAERMPAPTFAPSILATDVSAEALAVARRGRYPRAAAAHIPDEWQRGVAIDGDVLRIRREVAQLVSFEEGNLAVAHGRRGFDLIWCRNVLIYFAPEARQEAVDRLVATLEPGGFLFVGYSESLRDVAGLEAVTAGECTIYRKRSAAPRPTPTPLPFPPLSPAPAPSPSPSRSPSPSPSPPPVADTVAIRGHADPAAITAAISAALRSPGLRRLTVDLDAADHLGDEVAAVLRRARAAAAAAGIDLVWIAHRAPTQRWLRRHRLAEATP
jgi:chemotaxis protein methyltransferase CheR